MKREPTIQDVLDAVQVFSTHIDKRFENVERDITSMQRDITGMRGEMKDMRQDFGTISRKGNTKMTVLIDTLVSKKILDNRDADRILALEPYAQS